MGSVVLCVVHVDVNGSELYCGWLLRVVAICAWQTWSVLYAEAVEYMSNAGSVWHIRV